MSIVQHRARARSRSGRFISAAGRAVRGLRRGRPGMPHRRRGRGITARELRGFRKVVNLLHKVGMQPKRLGRVHRRAR